MTCIKQYVNPCFGDEASKEADLSVPTSKNCDHYTQNERFIKKNNTVQEVEIEQPQCKCGEKESWCLHIIIRCRHQGFRTKGYD